MDASLPCERPSDKPACLESQQSDLFPCFLAQPNCVLSGSFLGATDVFARDLRTNTTHLVSVNRTGDGGGNSSSFSPVISANGSVVAFRSFASNLHPLDNTTTSDVFARDLRTGTTHLVSVNSAGTAGGNGQSDLPMISADGFMVAFRSTASDLDALDNNSTYDIFAHDLRNNATQLVSVNSAGTGSGNSNSSHPVISADGSVVSFESDSTNLHPLDNDNSTDIFARDLSTGTTHLVSVNLTGIVTLAVLCPRRNQQVDRSRTGE